MQTLYSISFLIGVIMVAVCMTGIIEGVREDSEKRRLIRREKYRRKAYADVNKRRCQDSNRAELWRVYMR